MAETYSVLLVGLNAEEETLASSHFSKSGHWISTAKNIAEAQKDLSDREVQAVYLKASADDRAINELKRIVESFPALPVVLLCNRSAGDLILSAWRAGAADIIFVPLTSQSLDASLHRAVGKLASRDLERTAPMQARFFYLDETGKDCWAVIAPPKFTIGRSSDNSLVLGQMGISRSHAEVIVQDGEYLLRDLDSKQGTYLNGIRVKQSRLSNGDRVQLGGPQGMNLEFHEGDLLHSLLGDSDSKARINLSVRGFREVGMLFAAFQALSSIPVLDDLLALVVDTAIELTGAERGFIMLTEESGDLIFRCARNNRKCYLDGSTFNTSRRVPDDVFKTGQPKVIQDLDIGDGTDDHSATRRLGLRSISCVPLRYLTVRESDSVSEVGRSETIGVLYVDSANISVGVSKSRVDALQALAMEAAMAIYNARLFTISQEKRKMDEQLEIAREIQRALLPQPDKKLPYVQACSQNLPCHQIGGDYFDYFDLEGDRFGFVVGDVAGKGMPAALLASLVQGTFSAQTLFKASLPVMIANVNRNLAQRGTGNRFVTFFAGILDPDGNCTYVNAGHNPPFILSRDGSMRELTTGGMVLGLFGEAKYEADTVKLKPEDHVVLFTDGVIEALDSKGEEFGMKRLTDLMRANAQASAKDILTHLQEAVVNFSANTPQHDDITMMILGYREGA
jgi:sigma-B regulation protein RsbU (phosphoserine phosphatase)